MSLALLILRLFLALLLTGHAVQKLFGWFRGRGVTGTAQLFEASGLRPGWLMVVAAGLTELGAAALFALGLATPLAATMVIGAMLVAGATLAHNGLWAHFGGYEVPLTYGTVAFVLAIAGPGELSLDHLWGLDAYAGILPALIAAGVSAVLASPLLVMIVRRRRQG